MDRTRELVWALALWLLMLTVLVILNDNALTRAGHQLSDLHNSVNAIQAELHHP